MNNIKKIRTFYQYTQKQFAKLVGVDEETVSQWEYDSEPQRFSYDVLRDISLIFHISSDFIKGTGVFAQWDQIRDYYDAVTAELFNLIPRSLEMPTFCSDKYLAVWLDTRLYPPYKDEIELARWFAFAIQDIQIAPTGEDLDGNKTADVKITFTPEFAALIDAEEKRNKEPSSIMRVASIDGAFYVEELTDGQAEHYKMELDGAESIDDTNV